MCNKWNIAHAHAVRMSNTLVWNDDDAGVDVSLDVSSDEQDEFPCFSSSFNPVQDLPSCSERSPEKKRQRY